MNVRSKIKELLISYEVSLLGVVDGKATIEQQKITMDFLDAIQFYTSRLLIIGNSELGDTE